MGLKTSVFAAATVAVAGSLALAPVANAVPDPYSITVVGSTTGVDGHVQVNIDKPLGRQTCRVIGVPAGTDLADESKRVFSGSYTTSRTDPAWSWGFAPVPDGVYDVHWACVDENDAYWGSFPSVPSDRRQEPVRNIRVSSNPNATEGDPISFGSLDLGSLGGGSAFGS